MFHLLCLLSVCAQENVHSLKAVVLTALFTGDFQQCLALNNMTEGRIGLEGELLCIRDIIQ